MESESQKLGASLPVPSVKQLAEKIQIMAEIPSQYIRVDMESPPAAAPQEAAANVPVIDMQKLRSTSSPLLELEKLHIACKDWGFFQLTNHGVSSSVIERAKIALREFFDLPLEEKNKCRQKDGDNDGFGQLLVGSDNEQQQLQWSDALYLKTLPHHLRSSPHLFSNLPRNFREIIEECSAEMHKLSMEILFLLAKNTGIEVEEINDLFNLGLQTMRMNYYPPCPKPELVMGISPHSDTGGLTILFQTNETQGLEIKKDGAWIPILPLPNAFIVNVGDCVEILTNGIYRSIEHRAVVDKESERISFVTFQSPRLDAEIGPSKSLITPQNPPIFKRIKVVDFFRFVLGRKLDGKSHVDVLRISANHTEEREIND